MCVCVHVLYDGGWGGGGSGDEWFIDALGGGKVSTVECSSEQFPCDKYEILFKVLNTT